MQQKKALIVVDVQVDFCPGGALPVPEGDEVVPVLNRYMEIFTGAGLPVYASRDWHPARTRHFRDYGGIWPPHCVQDTEGARFHPGLRLPEDVIILTKGDMPDEDSYSCFQARDPQGRPLKEALKAEGVIHIYVGGLATDYCVKATVMDGLKEGFRVTLLKDAIKGVDINPGDSERAIDEMINAGAETITLERLKI